MHPVSMMYVSCASFIIDDLQRTYIFYIVYSNYIRTAMYLLYTMFIYIISYLLYILLTYI